MGAEAKRYLQEHSIPQLFEGLMTGLIYNRPNDPIQFLESAIAKLRQNPALELKWDAFVEPEARAKNPSGGGGGGVEEAGGMRKRAGTGGGGGGGTTTTPQEEAEQSKARLGTSAASTSSNAAARASRDSSQPAKKGSSHQNHNHQNGGTSGAAGGFRSRTNSHSKEKANASGGAGSSARRNSLLQAVKNAQIAPDAPIILFMGGPGGGKTRYAAQLQEQMRDAGLVHICMPDLVRTAIARYKDKHPEWRLAGERYQRGELIPNELAQQLVKAEMGKHPTAKAYLLEGFPREAKQVEDFERNVRPVDMALILDYDEEVLRRHMQSRGLLPEVVDRRINEFKQKTLPSAKYFDDQRLLHLIPGEKEDAVIIERMRKLVMRAVRSGVPAGGRRSGGIPNGGAASAASSSTGAALDERQNGGTETGGTPNPTQTPQMAMAQNGEIGKEEKMANNVAEGGGGSMAATPLEAVENANTPKHGNGANSAAAGGTAGGRETSAKIDSKSPSAGTAKSAAGSSTAAAQTSSRAESAKTRDGTAAAGIQQQQENGGPSPTAESMPQRPPTNSAKKSAGGGAGNSGSAGSAGRGRLQSIGKKENAAGGGGGSREGSGKSHQAISSTVSTPKPSEGPFQELLTNSSQTATASATKTPVSPFQNDSDTFPKGLPSEAPVILIIGAPGSNKSKFGQKIARKYDGFVHLSMGELFRRKVLQNGEDELWTRIGKKMDAGETIPSRICRDLLYTALHERGQNGWGYVIEGYPRTLQQAEDIEAQLGRIDLAILIDCTEQFCRDALRKRFEKAKEEGAERADDDEGVVRVRLSLFKQNTLPMLKHLDDKGLLRVVRWDGPSSIAVAEHNHHRPKIEGDTNEDKVYQEIFSIIDNTIFIQDDGNGKSLGSSSKQNSVDELVEQPPPPNSNEQQPSKA